MSYGRGMIRLVSATALLILLAGCSSPRSTSTLQERTADATAAAKRGAGAIVRGVAEGLTRKGPLNINTATERQISDLPGISSAEAAAIVAGRPYKSTRDLVRRHILTAAEFDQVKSRTVAE